MTEEIIYCPSCNNKVRVPEEMLGQTVQCPLCRLVFVAPVRGPGQPSTPPPLVIPAPPQAPAPMAQPPGSPWDRADETQHALLQAVVRPPAIALLVVGILGWMSSARQALATKLNGVEGVVKELEEMRRKLDDAPPNPFFDMFKQAIATTPPESIYWSNLITGFVFMLVATGTIIGAAQMLRQRGYWLAIIGSVLAIVNLQNCCCVLGLPFGIWSLVVLSRPEVRRAFE